MSVPRSPTGAWISGSSGLPLPLTGSSRPGLLFPGCQTASLRGLENSGCSREVLRGVTRVCVPFHLFAFFRFLSSGSFGGFLWHRRAPGEAVGMAPSPEGSWPSPCPRRPVISAPSDLRLGSALPPHALTFGGAPGGTLGLRPPESGALTLTRG